MMRRILLVIFALALTLTACGGGGNDVSHPAKTPAGSAQATTPTPSPKPSGTATTLIWSRVVQSAGETQVWYVARVTNHADSPASVVLDARALDSSGTVVGSEQPTLPNIPAGVSFDFFGTIGALYTNLTGKPAKVEVSQAASPPGQAGAADMPMLGTSEVKLTRAAPDETFTGAPYAYDMSAKVTNSTSGEITSGVTQQVVLYDSAGRVVGGGSGFSDNAPGALPAGLSYREEWTGISAFGRAASVRYTAWPSTG